MSQPMPLTRSQRSQFTREKLISILEEANVKFNREDTVENLLVVANAYNLVNKKKSTRVLREEYEEYMSQVSEAPGSEAPPRQRSIKSPRTPTKGKRRSRNPGVQETSAKTPSKKERRESEGEKTPRSNTPKSQKSQKSQKKASRRKSQPVEEVVEEEEPVEEVMEQPPHITTGGISMLDEISYTYNSVIGARITLVVMATLRYPVDRLYYKHLNEIFEDGRKREGMTYEEMVEQKENEIKFEGDSDAFDLILSDGQHYRKAVLHPSLNSLIHLGYLRLGSVVQINRYRNWVDDRIVGGRYVILLEDLEIMDTVLQDDGRHFRSYSEVQELLESLTPKHWHEYKSDTWMLGVPLIGMRRYYLGLWNDNMVLGSQWFDDLDLSVAEEEMAILEHDGIVLLKDVLPPPHHTRVTRRYERFVARIAQKSRLFHYAKPEDSHRVPFHFFVRLYDNHTTARMVIWTSKARQYFHHLQIGDLVLVSGFTLKKDYLDKDSWEIVINATKPEGDIRKLSNLQYPLPTMIDAVPCKLPLYSNINDEQMRLLQRMPDGTLFDFVGVVTFVGREERQRVDAGEGKLVSYRHTRWIKIADPFDEEEDSDSVYHELPVRLEATYHSTDYLTFHDVEVGDIVLLSDLTLASFLTDSVNIRFLYALGSAVTETYKLDPSKDPREQLSHHVVIAKIEQAIAFRDKYVDLMRQRDRFGLDTVYLFPPSLQIAQQATKYAMRSLADEWDSEIRYIERRDYMVQGSVTLVDCVDAYYESKEIYDPNDMSAERRRWMIDGHTPFTLLRCYLRSFSGALTREVFWLIPIAEGPQWIEHLFQYLTQWNLLQEETGLDTSDPAKFLEGLPQAFCPKIIFQVSLYYAPPRHMNEQLVIGAWPASAALPDDELKS